MKSDSSDKSDSYGEEDSSDEEAPEEQVISSTAEDQPPYYEHIQENAYLIDKKKRINKEVRKMTCECYPEPDDEEFVCCGEDCLNRLLMIECNHRCPCGDLCTNKRFQQGCKNKVEVFKTEKKGWGVRTLEDLEENQFVIEYCGEVMNYSDFQHRAQRYDRQKRRHYYFMTLRANEIIDATCKGSISRFINHSCDPNCVTQKWTVNGLLRIGFFTLKKISAGEELTFDYQLQRYGKIAQTCYCESPNCRGIIGGEKHTPLKNTIERISTASTSSPRRRKKRNISSDFDDLTLEDELEKLIGEHRGMTDQSQALKMSRLMVRAEDLPQRIMLLKVLQYTTDQSCLKAFLRFQGLSLLWSWMVDAGTKPSSKLQLELLATLKYLPVTTKNQLEDSKVLRVVNKWAVTTAVEVDVPSSCSSQDGNTDDVGHTHEDTDQPPVCKGEKEELSHQLSSTSSKEQSEEETAETTNTDDKDDAEKTCDIHHDKSPDEMSEDDKSTEDDLLSDGDENVGSSATDLLKQWSALKEIYRIPKKTPVKKNPEVIVTSSTGTPGATQASEKEISTLMSQPDSSGKFEEPTASCKEENRTVPAALMSLAVPLMSKGEPSNAGTSGSATSVAGRDEELISDDSEWKSCNSQIPSSTEEGVHPVPIVSSDDSTQQQQVFGYKQRMGAALMEQPFDPQLENQWRSRKQGRKWSKPGYQQYPPHAPHMTSPNMAGSRMHPGYSPGNMAMNPWHAPPQHWQNGPQEQQQRPPFYGPHGPGTMLYQQYPAHQTTNVSTPNMPIPTNFPRNIPPPNYPPPTQQIPYPPQSPYRRPPPNMVPQLTNIVPDGALRFHTPTPGLPPQQNMPPVQGPFSAYNAAASSQAYQYKMTEHGQSPLVDPHEFRHSSGMQPDPVTTPESTGPEGYLLNRDLQPQSPSPVKPKPKQHNLPVNWKTATDPQGKIYYYHTVTRQTQWDPPEHVRSPVKPNTDMDMETPSEKEDEEPPAKKKKPRTPKTPPGTPPRSPTLAYTTAAADTTENRCVLLTPPGNQDSANPSQRMKESFRVKLSNVVVNCLNPFFKVDCKEGRITNVDDFKYLARKLTHGVMMKELQHVKSEEHLQCNDSVKVKTKDFIRSYMRKFGAVYKRT